MDGRKRAMAHGAREQTAFWEGADRVRVALITLQAKLELLLPGLEGVGEDALAGRAFFQSEDGAAVVVVNDRDVEPAALLEHLQIAILVGIDVGEADEI